ncbi:hypothetical protein RhiirC2_803397 [Rhizophagus irregularis]|uniref:Uncharacterized protein n=1 Tax=Rhizophagus irregularis TaxID=588596 RepID=A0A2N1LLA5_9GLOM|nr:hypothetical protein RhiirC2_803397 [Rhizophagus irregularis]
MFLFKNITFLNNFSFILILLLVSKFPAFENRYSLIVEVAETTKYSLTSLTTTTLDLKSCTIRILLFIKDFD